MAADLGVEKAIYRTTTYRYLLAVLIVALLATSAYFTLQSALSDAEATAHLVNLSGRQRMLSQHIALDAYRSYQADKDHVALSDQQQALLLKNITDMRQANRQLSSGVLSEHRTVSLSAAIRDIYFGDLNLHVRINDYLDIAEKLHATANVEEKLHYLNVLDAQSPQLLLDLNSAVQQYQREGEARVKNIEQLELIVWLATLIVLILEVFLIFKPMARVEASSQKAQAKMLENLEDMVELRTLKLEVANQQLQELAVRDPLTKLKNRLTLESDVEHLVEMNQYKHMCFALCVIDVDWFKKVNDTYGHPAGDYVLKELALVMNKVTREYDHLYRTGGEEFVLVLNRVKFDETVSILENLREAVKNHLFEFEGKRISITISSGFYHSDRLSINRVHDIVRVADHALYRAKRSGRDCIRAATQEEDMS